MMSADKDQDHEEVPGLLVPVLRCSSKHIHFRMGIGSGTVGPVDGDEVTVEIAADAGALVLTFSGGRNAENTKARTYIVSIPEATRTAYVADRAARGIPLNKSDQDPRQG
jgi:hypothetical protein